MHRQLVRTLLLVGGFVFLALAIVGTILPIMPTVPFLLVAIACFSRSSKRMHQWILGLPGVGKELRAWEEQRAISRKAKTWATFALVGLVAVPIWFRDVDLWLKLTANGFVVALVVFILSRPNPRSV